MFFELSKLLNFFLFPVTWIVALLIGSMALRKYPWVRKLCLWGSAVLFLVFTNGPLFDLAKSSMIEEYRFPHWEEGKIYRVAIVMGGFAGMNEASFSTNKTGQIAFGKPYDCSEQEK